MHDTRAQSGGQGRAGAWRGVALSCVATATLFLAAIPHRPRLLWNASGSVPLGLYRVEPATSLRRGDLVVAWPPARAARLAAARGYLPRGVPLVKRIIALPGEQVCARGGMLRAPLGVAVRSLTRDRAGRILPRWRGCGQLGANRYLLLATPMRDSFDGRYFGPTERADIVGEARPIWLL